MVDGAGGIIQVNHSRLTGAKERECIHRDAIAHSLTHTLFTQPLLSRTRKHTQIHLHKELSCHKWGVGDAVRIYDSLKVTANKVHLRGAPRQVLRTYLCELSIWLQDTQNEGTGMSPYIWVVFVVSRGGQGVLVSLFADGEAEDRENRCIPRVMEPKPVCDKDKGLTQTLTFACPHSGELLKSSEPILLLGAGWLAEGQWVGEHGRAGKAHLRFSCPPMSREEA